MTWLCRVYPILATTILATTILPDWPELNNEWWIVKMVTRRRRTLTSLTFPGLWVDGQWEEMHKHWKPHSVSTGIRCPCQPVWNLEHKVWSVWQEGPLAVESTLAYAERLLDEGTTDNEQSAPSSSENLQWYRVSPECVILLTGYCAEGGVFCGFHLGLDWMNLPLQ